MVISFLSLFSLFLRYMNEMVRTQNKTEYIFDNQSLNQSNAQVDEEYGEYEELKMEYCKYKISDHSRF